MVVSKKKNKFIDPGKRDKNPNFTPAFQSVPGRTPPIETAPKPRAPGISTPERQTGKASAQRFIREREKRASQLAHAAGIEKPTKEQMRQASAEAAEATPEQVSAGKEAGVTSQAEASLSGLQKPEDQILTKEEIERQRGRALVDVVGTAAFVALPFALPGAGIAVSVGSRAILSAVTGGVFGTAILGNEKQKTAEIAANFLGSKQLIGQAIMDLEAGLISTDRAIFLINSELENIGRQERALKILVSNRVSAQLSKASDELADINSFKKEFNFSTMPRVRSAAFAQAGLGQPQTIQ